MMNLEQINQLGVQQNVKAANQQACQKHSKTFQIDNNNQKKLTNILMQLLPLIQQLLGQSKSSQETNQQIPKQDTAAQQNQGLSNTTSSQQDTATGQGMSAVASLNTPAPTRITDEALNNSGPLLTIDDSQLVRINRAINPNAGNPNPQNTTSAVGDIFDSNGDGRISVGDTVEIFTINRSENTITENASILTQEQFNRFETEPDPISNQPGSVGGGVVGINSPGAQSAPSAQGSDTGGGVVGTNSPGAQSAPPQNCNTARN